AVVADRSSARRTKLSLNPAGAGGGADDGDELTRAVGFDAGGVVTAGLLGRFFGVVLGEVFGSLFGIGVFPSLSSLMTSSISRRWPTFVSLTNPTSRWNRGCAVARRSFSSRRAMSK